MRGEPGLSLCLRAALTLRSSEPNCLVQTQCHEQLAILPQVCISIFVRCALRMCDRDSIQQVLVAGLTRWGHQFPCVRKPPGRHPTCSGTTCAPTASHER